MSFVAPITPATAVNHVSAVERLAYAASDIRNVRDLIVSEANKRMHKATVLMVRKMRFLLQIPHHEWAEAINRDSGSGSRRVTGVQVSLLIEAYVPRYNLITKEFLEGPRCPPWAGRRYRAECERVRSEALRSAEQGVTA